uniref:Uncharacterized protein n=1 Tax=Setaria italica TaxID=4555 RepID=K3XP15_SETIT
MYKGVHSQQTALYLCIPDKQSKGHPRKKKTETHQFSLIFFRVQLPLILTRSRPIPVASSSVHQNYPKF